MPLHPFSAGIGGGGLYAPEKLNIQVNAPSQLLSQSVVIFKVRTLVMARVLEDAPKDAGLEGVGVASLVIDIRVPETGRCRNFSSGLSEDLSEYVSF